MKSQLMATTAMLACCLALPAMAQDAKPMQETQITAHVVKPAKSKPDLAALKVPDGFKIEVFADGLINPRMMAVSEDGTVYVTRRSVGDVVMLKDTDGDGKADVTKTVASRPQMHGIAIKGDRIYLTTVESVYVAEIAKDGTLGELKEIIDDLPDSGQHPNRTIAIGPDGMLYISVGSTCNACDESSPESAAMLRARVDGGFRTIYASGLRNTIGFGFHPDTGVMWGMDHGIDWLGDDDQPEELNRIEQGKKYGWPYIYADGRENPQDEPPGELTMADWKAASENPVLVYTAHAAPMQMAFASGDMFPADYRGDAFVAMRGSWNRKPPSGYEVVRIRFENGEAKGMEPFVTGFLQEKDGAFTQAGRLAGLVFAKDGAMLFSDDENGVIYRVSRDAESADADKAEPARTAEAEPESETKPDAAATEKAERRLAVEILNAKGGVMLEVESESFAPGKPIPERYSAYGEDVSPQLSWSAGPDGTKSYVVLMEDPDVPATIRPFVHWIAYNIPADVTSLREGLPAPASIPHPEGMRQAANTRGSLGYFGPKPPAGPAHNYHFQVFALDTVLDLAPGADRKAVLDAMQDHVLGMGEIVGVFKAPAGEGS
jgi:Raf kinase inhibitor-like YbhB/YbcL family protein